MIKRFQSVFVGVLWGSLFLYALTRALLNYLSTGRSLWWFALELGILAATFACLVLLDRVLPKPELEAIRGTRAVAAAALVIFTLIPAVVAGVFLDSLLGFELSFGAVLATSAVLAAVRLIGARLSPLDAGRSEAVQATAFSGLSSESTPPN